MSSAAAWRLRAAALVASGASAVAAPQTVHADCSEAALAGSLQWAIAIAVVALLVQLLFVRALRVGEHAANKDDGLTFREDEGISKLVPLHPEVKKPLKEYTMEEVGQHDASEDMWVCVDGFVYDVTNYSKKHPGGFLTMMNVAGKDCTDAFMNYHPARITRTMLPSLVIGKVSDYKVAPHVADFREVRQELLRRNLYATDMTFYMKMGTWYALLFLSALYLSLVGDCMATRMTGALMMGIFWQQLAGLGHDLGHSGVTHVFWKDHLVGSVLSSLMGISTCWWKRNHNTHHVACNSIEHDPDIQHMPILAVSPQIWDKPFWSTYYNKWVKMDAFARWAVGHQDRLFFLVMGLARFNLYVQSLVHLCASEKMYYRKTELVSMLVYFGWVLGVTFSQRSLLESVMWLLISHGASGLLHVQIVASHWAMNVYHGKAYNDDADEWYLTQIKTTMNVDTNPWLDFVHIGLQFQIEHHLYPRLPRHSLRAARELVQGVCAKHGIHYHEPGFFQAVAETCGALAAAAADARMTKKGKSGFYESVLWDGLTLSG